MEPINDPLVLRGGRLVFRMIKLNPLVHQFFSICPLPCHVQASGVALAGFISICSGVACVAMCVGVAVFRDH